MTLMLLSHEEIQEDSHFVKIILPFFFFWLFFFNIPPSLYILHLHEMGAHLKLVVIEDEKAKRRKKKVA